MDPTSSPTIPKMERTPTLVCSVAITLILPFLSLVRLLTKNFEFAHICELPSVLGHSNYAQRSHASPLVVGLNDDADIELDLQVLDIANPALQY